MIKENNISFDQYKLRHKYTALWAFSESVFGGILHALKIPFTGLFLGGIAIVILSLIATLVEKKRDLIKATLIVISIKFLLSPNTPFTAYVAVLMQGIFAFLIFSFISNRVIAISLLSFLTAIWSSAQKIVVTTVLFGMNFWYSIDAFTIYVIKSFGFELNNNFSMSLVLIALYFLLHLGGALFFAGLAIKLPVFLQKSESKFQHIQQKYSEFHSNLNDFQSNGCNKKNKKWYQKPTRVLLITFLLVIAFITYLNPEFGKIKLINVISMILRAIVIIFLWFSVVMPLFVKMLRKLLSTNSNFSRLDEYTSLFPEFRKIISFCWEINSQHKRMRRIFLFLKDSFILLMKL